MDCSGYPAHGCGGRGLPVRKPTRLGHSGRQLACLGFTDRFASLSGFSLPRIGGRQIPLD
jgi:hypothetical protein